MSKGIRGLVPSGKWFIAFNTTYVSPGDALQIKPDIIRNLTGSADKTTIVATLVRRQVLWQKVTGNIRIPFDGTPFTVGQLNRTTSQKYRSVLINYILFYFLFYFTFLIFFATFLARQWFI